MTTTPDRMTTPRPPVAKREPTTRSLHGVELTDDYAWLSAREDPAVLDHLREENAYTDAMTAHTAAFREELYAELLGRVQQTDTGAPYRYGDFAYYTRTVEGLEYRIRCRRPWPDGPEEVILDENELAEGHAYLSTGDVGPSPDHSLLAYAYDTVGRERYSVVVKDLATGELLPDRIDVVSDEIVWAADGQTFFYATLDETERTSAVWRHRLGTDRSEDVCVWDEPDKRFSIYLYATASHRFIVALARSATTCEVRVIDAADPTADPVVIAPRRQGVEYYVEHQSERFVIWTNHEAKNFRVVTAPLDAPDDWTELVPGREAVKIESVTPFADHLVIGERENGLMHLRVLGLSDGSDGRIEMPEPVYVAGPGPNVFYDTTVFRFVYTSLTTPPSHYDYDMATGERTLVKRQPVLGGYDPDAYVTERVWATATDGVRVPISLVHRADTPADGTAPGLLYGYGSYGASMDPIFSSNRLSLLDRGYVYAIAHVRGGGELGETWRDDGKMLAKRNTFTDFIACAEHLLEHGFVARGHLAAMGGSAGGLLMGAAVNMRPDLFAAIVAQVPFVDVLNTMLDPSIPLTVGELEEWGDPNDPTYFASIRSYSPYDNVAAQDYPPMLVMSGFNDLRVQYWEPAKWVAKLRALSTGDHPVLLRMELEHGHMGPSGRYETYREVAFIYAFILDTVGGA